MGTFIFSSLEQVPIQFYHRATNYLLSVQMRADGPAAHSKAPSLHLNPHSAFTIPSEEKNAHHPL